MTNMELRVSTYGDQENILTGWKTGSGYELTRADARIMLRAAESLSDIGYVSCDPATFVDATTIEDDVSRWDDDYAHNGEPMPTDGERVAIDVGYVVGFGGKLVIFETNVYDIFA